MSEHQEKQKSTSEKFEVAAEVASECLESATVLIPSKTDTVSSVDVNETVQSFVSSSVETASNLATGVIEGAGLVVDAAAEGFSDLLNVLS